MSRLQSTYNNDLVINRENNVLLNKMLKNRRPAPVPQTALQRERQPLQVEIKSKRDRSQSRILNQAQLAIPRQVPKPIGAILKVEEPRRKASAHDLVHKEVFNNNMATVEVTVRTVAPKDAEDNAAVEEMREPWSKILAPKKSEENIQCNFGNFDPLRTLHFLSKELQLKLQCIYPGDPSVGQIVKDMQNVMQRLPPDVLSQLYASEHFANTSSGDNEPPTNMKRLNDMKSVCKSSQTVIIGDVETKKMQQQLEDSAMKLEASCKEMETVCNKLRSERDELESMLIAERENVAALKKDLQEHISEKDEKINNEISKLTAERDILRNQIKELHTTLESQAGQNAEDLRNLVEELHNKQLTAEQECTARRNEITMMKLERDKMNVLLECRDKQLKELRTELEHIQQLVSAQLMEFKVKPTFSTTSTLSSCASQLWNSPSSVKSHKGKSLHEIFLNNDVMRKMLLSKDLQTVESGTITTLNADEIMKDQQGLKLEDIQEIPQREKSQVKVQDSQMTFSDAETVDTEYKQKLSSHPSIRDMFAEIKRQAFKTVKFTSSTSNSKESPSDGQSQDRDSHGSISS